MIYPDIESSPVLRRDEIPWLIPVTSRFTHLSVCRTSVGS